jgi:NifU-like protein involved in Fe-S cluster formation
LEKHFVPHQEIEELEETDEMDNIMIEDMSYAQLRGMQNAHIGRSFSKLNQKDSSTLLQVDALQSEILDIDTKSEIEVDAIA